MKTVKTRKILKKPINKRRQRILAKAFGTDRERVKSFHEDDRGEDRKFKSSLPGFKYREENHEASLYLSKTVGKERGQLKDSFGSWTMTDEEEEKIFSGLKKNWKRTTLAIRGRRGTPS